MGTIADKLQYLLSTKTGLRDKLIEKGVDVPATTPFRNYIDKLDEISNTSDTTAVAEDVKAGKLFHIADGTLTEGTLEYNPNPYSGVCVYAGYTWQVASYTMFIYNDGGTLTATNFKVSTTGSGESGSTNSYENEYVYVGGGGNPNKVTVKQRARYINGTTDTILEAGESVWCYVVSSWAPFYFYFYK